MQNLTNYHIRYFYIERRAVVLEWSPGELSWTLIREGKKQPNGYTVVAGK